MDLPSGTVTLLFTDVESSTKLWEDHPSEMKGALERHDTILRESIEAHGGYVFKTVGDAFCAAFEEPLPAVYAAVAVQGFLGAEPWPARVTIRVRMAIHSGACHERGGDFFGPPANRAARLLVLGHGGQILVSGAAAGPLADDLPEHLAMSDLGRHRLKDLERPERVFQLCAPDLQVAFGPLACVEGASVEHNLPRSATHFVGRVEEVAEVRRQLGEAGSSLVTLTGSGGVGKTRLALEVAAQLLDGPGDGVWLVELAHVAASEHVAQKIATILGVREEPGRSVLDSVIEDLKEREITLVLDNCEHVVEASAEAADAVLKSCSEVRLLATSREPLGIDGEHVHRVPSLEVPPDDTDPRDLIAYESLQLFAERAVHHRPGFVLGVTNAVATAAICRQLDGIPLAIELAAARLRTMSVDEIEDRLDARFRLLSAGSRTAVARHKTLRASIDWSYDLLNAEEQLLLDRLSVFVGGFELDSAEAVCSRDGCDAVSLLAALVDKSLVEADEVEEQIRYRVLETIRQYAAERLDARGPGEIASSRGAHRDHFLALAQHAALALRRKDGVRWLDTLEMEHANLRAALNFCLTDGDVETGLRLAVALRLFWSVRGYGVEALDTLDKLLDSADGTDGADGALQAHALTTTAYLLGIHGSYESGLFRARRAVDLARTIDDAHSAADALVELGALLRFTGNFEDALSAYEEAVRLATGLTDTHILEDPAVLDDPAVLVDRADLDDLDDLDDPGPLVARATGGRATTLGSLGQIAEARAGLSEAIDVLDKSGDRFVTVGMLCDLGLLELEAGDSEVARAHLDEALGSAEQLGDEVHKCSVEAGLGIAAVTGSDPQRALKWYSQALVSARRTGNRALLARSISGLAIVAADVGDSLRSAKLLGAADRIFKELRFVPGSLEAQLVAGRSAQLRQDLGPVVFGRAREDGSEMTETEILSQATLRAAIG